MAGTHFFKWPREGRVSGVSGEGGGGAEPAWEGPSWRGRGRTSGGTGPPCTSVPTTHGTCRPPTLSLRVFLRPAGTRGRQGQRPGCEGMTRAGRGTWKEVSAAPRVPCRRTRFDEARVCSGPCGTGEPRTASARCVPLLQAAAPLRCQAAGLLRGGCGGAIKHAVPSPAAGASLTEGPCLLQGAQATRPLPPHRCHIYVRAEGSAPLCPSSKYASPNEGRPGEPHLGPCVWVQTHRLRQARLTFAPRSLSAASPSLLPSLALPPPNSLLINIT